MVRVAGPKQFGTRVGLVDAAEGLVQPTSLTLSRERRCGARRLHGLVGWPILRCPLCCYYNLDCTTNTPPASKRIKSMNHASLFARVTF